MSSVGTPNHCSQSSTRHKCLDMKCSLSMNFSLELSLNHCDEMGGGGRRAMWDANQKVLASSRRQHFRLIPNGVQTKTIVFDFLVCGKSIGRNGCAELWHLLWHHDEAKRFRYWLTWRRRANGIVRTERIVRWSLWNWKWAKRCKPRPLNIAAGSNGTNNQTSSLQRIAISRRKDSLETTPSSGFPF